MKRRKDLLAKCRKGRNERSLGFSKLFHQISTFSLSLCISLCSHFCSFFFLDLKKLWCQFGIFLNGFYFLIVNVHGSLIFSFVNFFLFFTKNLPHISKNLGLLSDLGIRVLLFYRIKFFFSELKEWSQRFLW